MARVECSNADTFLTSYATTFAWHPQEGLVYGIYDEVQDKWHIYQNKTHLKETYTGHMITHLDIASRIGMQIQSAEWIKGRISPDYKTIFVHDLNNRDYSAMIQKRFDFFVDKAINALYKYLEGRLK